MSASFDNAMKRIPDDSRTRIRENLVRFRRSSGKCARINWNITSECHLNQDDYAHMEGILKLFESAQAGDNQRFIKRYDSACRNCTAKGDTITALPEGKRLGRVVPTGVFRQMIRSLLDLDQVELDGVMFSLEHHDSCHPLLTEERVSAYPIWVTWSDQRTENDPFYFARKRSVSYEVCANLGLSHLQQHEPHYLLVFAYEKTMEVLFPTVADAGTYEYFKTSNEDDNHGYTLPYTADDFKKNGGECELKPRPEGIMNPVSFKQLEFPTQIFESIDRF